jgi:hypothetical protein
LSRGQQGELALDYPPFAWRRELQSCVLFGFVCGASSLCLIWGAFLVFFAFDGFYLHFQLLEGAIELEVWLGATIFSAVLPHFALDLLIDVLPYFRVQILYLCFGF